MARPLSQRVYYKARNLLAGPLKRGRFQLAYRWNGLTDALFKPRVDGKQSVIINGFWRSGTTWIQDLVCRELVSKPLFEPFEPGLNPDCKFIFRYANAFKEFPDDRRFTACLMPNSKEGLPTEEDLWQFLTDVVYGSHRDPGLLRNRRSLAEGMRRHVVVKFVRGHFMLSALSERLGLPVIHVRRDPYAVVGSLIRNPNWNFGGFQNLDLKRLLLSDEDGKAPVLAPLRRQILDVDENGSEVMKIAAYWSATEWVAEKELEKLRNRGMRIDYEDVVEGGASFLRDCLAHLGLTISGRLENAHMQRRSSTTHTDVVYKSRDDFVRRSRERLSEEQRAEIRSVLVRFGMVKQRR